MAVAFDGFSIREHTSKMRSIDVLKCWPFSSSFSDKVSRKDLESWLPPMTVPKFRWWSNELEAVRSSRDGKLKEENQPLEEEISTTESESVKSTKSGGAEEEKLEMVCPVCRVFNAATLTAVNAHIDGCLAQKMREERRQMRMMTLKSKSKAPKKRSIAEIFEVEEDQPQVDSVLKFWPFSKNPDEVSITVTKFRWWSRRLEALRSNQVEGEISRDESELRQSEEGDGVEEDKLEMICPVCRVFNATTVTAVNAHIDGCLAQAVREERRQMKMSLKPKPKAPKKRSIAEILTVAPQIEARTTEVIEVEEEEEQEEKSEYSGGDSCGDGDAFAVVSTTKSKKNTKKGRKKKKTRKLKKKNKEGKKYCSGVTLNNEKVLMNKKKYKKKKSLFNNKLKISMKEDAIKCKLKTPVDSARKMNTIANKKVSLDDVQASAHLKKSSLKFFSVEKKQKGKKFDSDDEQQKPVPLVSTILKDHSKHISERKSNSCNIQEGEEETPCDVQVLTSDRHVRFSCEDGTISPMKNSFDEIMFSSSSEAQATSLGKEQSSGSEEEVAALVVNESDGNSDFNIDKRKDVYPAVDSKQFSNNPEKVTVRNFLRPCTNQEKPKNLDEKSESLIKVALCENNSFHQFDKGITTTLQYFPYAGISGPLPAPIQAGQVPIIKTQVGDSRAFSSTGKFIDDLEDPTYQVATVNSTANTRTFLQPSSSYSAFYNEANEGPQCSSQSYGDDNDGQALGYRPFSHLFSTDVMDNSFPLAGWGRESARNNCTDDNFFGLPLNSHGELINFSSSGNEGMKQPQTSSTLRSFSSGLPVNNFVYPSSQESLSISERHFVQNKLPKDCVNPFTHYPARLGVTELQGSERADNHWPNSNRCFNNYGCPLDSRLNLLKNPFVEQNQCEKLQKHKGNWVISPKESSDLISHSSSQPTMRLMGKDVPIGRSSKEMPQFVEEDVWAGEESRRRNNSEDTALENSLLERCSKQGWVSGSPLQTSTENVSPSVKCQSNQALQRTSLINGRNSELPQPVLDLQTDHPSQHRSPGIQRNANSYLHPITHAPTSRAVFVRPPDLSEHSISGAKPPGLISQLQVPPTPCNFGKYTCLSNGQLNDRNKLPLVTKSAFEFPFLHSGVGEHAKTSWFQSVPPWLLSSVHEKLPHASSQQFSGQSSKIFSYNIRGGNFTTHSVNYSEEVLYPQNLLASQRHTKSPLFPASVVQAPLVPVTPAIQPTSTIDSGCRNKINVTDRMKLNDMTTGDHHPCKNTRKRPAANLDDSSKPMKVTNVGVQENSNLNRLTRGNSSSELQRDIRVVELDPLRDSTRSKCCCHNDAQSSSPKSYPGVDSFQVDGTVISSPVRLSPGTMHILKPSQNMDQDNSGPIHSAIPFAATTDCDRNLDIQRKLTKIYRL